MRKRPAAGAIGVLCAGSLALASACLPSDEGAGECEYGVQRQALAAEDRNIVGAGGAYPSDPMLRERSDELYRSQAERRQVAWRSVEKILAPIAVARQPGEVAGALPLWRSWYGGDEVQRLFQHLYAELPASEQHDRARFPHAQIDRALGWNLRSVEELANWPSERRDAYLQAIDSEARLAGIAGVGRTSYSPDALRHLLRSYPELLACMDSDVPAAVVDGTGPSVQLAVREPVSIGACASQRFGPFVVAPGDELHAHIEGSEAELLVSTVDDPRAQPCAGQDPSRCTFAGPNSYYVTVQAGAEAVAGVVHIDHLRQEPSFASCLEAAFPQSAVIVKADWRRVQFGALLPAYDTSAASLARAMSQDDERGWGPGDRQVDPQEEQIYTIELPGAQRYRLAALHIMTKELDHWQWITLWWSDRPDTDFGADRPASLASLGPWGNYKMCVVTDFSEGDPDADGGFADTAPTLAAALRAVNGGVGAASFCSNPYIELGPGNVQTNCIGCHQHGGAGLISEEILADEQLFPEHGRRQARNNFPHDYTWSIDDGDRLGLAFQAVVDYFD